MIIHNFQLNDLIKDSLMNSDGSAINYQNASYEIISFKDFLSVVFNNTFCYDLAHLREYLGTYGEELEGKCQEFFECPPRHVFWPRTKKCYEYHTRGPCLKGYLIYINPDTGNKDDFPSGSSYFIIYTSKFSFNQMHAQSHCKTLYLISVTV